MANYTETFTSKLDWAMPFQRTGKFPLDRTDLFSSYDDAVKYAAGNTADPDSRGLCGTSYVGQIITVYENDAVTCYKIDPDRSLTMIGFATLGDDASIVLADGALRLAGFQEAVKAGNYNGKQPRIGADGKLEWFTPDMSSVGGLSSTIAGHTERIEALEEQAENLESNKVDKEEGKGLSANDYTTDEKTKLSGVAAGAQVNIIETVKVNGTAQTVSGKAVDITVPTKLGDLTNDKDFIDNTVSNLANYYIKTETYSKTEVNELVGQIATIQISVVESLPTVAEGKSNVIYLVAKTKSETQNVYDEYLFTGTAFEKVGDTTIDLSNYLTKAGDASNATAKFTTAAERAVPATGETLAVILGKVTKYLGDLHAVAFSGDYSDLTNKPMTLANQTVTIAAGATSVTGSFANLVAYRAYDADGEMVTIDCSKSGNNYIFSIASAVSGDVTIDVTYGVTA